MKISSIFLYLFISSLLFGDMSPQYMVFAADKSRDSVAEKLSIARTLLGKNQKISELKDRYKFDYSIVSFADYYAIKLSPIKSYELKEQLTFVLKANFPNLISVDLSQQRWVRHEKHYTTVSNHEDTISTILLNSIDKDQIKEYAKETHYWLEKWHALIVLLLLGAFFYYRRRHQINDIKLLQQDLSKEQDAIEIKINEYAK